MDTPFGTLDQGLWTFLKYKLEYFRFLQLLHAGIWHCAEEDSVSPIRGSLICPPGKSIIFHKKETEKNWVSSIEGKSSKETVALLKQNVSRYFSAQPIFPGQPPPLARINVQQQQQQQPPPRQSSQPPSRTEFREPYAQATSVIHQPQEAVVVR